MLDNPKGPQLQLVPASCYQNSADPACPISMIRITPRCRAGARFRSAGSFATLTLLLLVPAARAALAGGNPQPFQGPVSQAPPPAPPIEHGQPAAPGPATQPPKGLTLYSIGQPTDEEQLYLEFLNRMRADPSAEGQRLATTTDADVLSAYGSFGVNLSLMQSEFNTNPAVPPLAMNARLLAAARWHSGDMYTNQYQGHYQTNGAIVMGPGDRIHTNGYNFSVAGENVFAYAKSVWYGHAGFAVDWGFGVGGMQDPAGHRANMLNGLYREAGMGVTDGSNGPVGPQLITQDFGAQLSPVPFISGVVYYDFNGNGFYDVGEGIGGITVNSPGSAYYAVTADSGGYAIPVSSNGNYTITFSASGLSTQQVVTISAQNNVKVDFVPLYSPPVISGPNPAYVNQSNTYSFSAVGAATSYQWLQTELAPYTIVEGAENGLAGVTAVSSPGYSVVSSDFANSGSFSYHLAQPDGANQFLMLNVTVLPSAASQLSFAKLLGWATSSQIAKAQVSTNGGSSWQDVWSEPGSGGSGDAAFTTLNVSLGAFAGQNLQIRFGYSFTSGSYFPQTDPGVGLYLDDIAVSNASQLLNPITNNIPAGNSFAFYPTNNGTYVLQARAQINSRTLAWGPPATINVTTAPPALQIVSKPTLLAGSVQIDFTVANYRSGMTFQLWKTSDLEGTWVVDSAASLTTLIANSKFRLSTATGGANRMFYRVKASY